MKTRTLVWILAVWLVSLAIMMLTTGCKTVSRVERLQVHDTVYRVRHDTAHVFSKTSRADTVLISERVEIIKNTSGDTVSVLQWRERWRERWRHDTVYIYRTVTDSARRANVVTNTTKISKKPKNPFFFACVALIVIGVGVYTIRRKQRNRRKIPKK